MPPVCGMQEATHPPRGQRCRPPRGCRAGSRCMGRGARTPPWVLLCLPPFPVQGHRRCLLGTDGHARSWTVGVAKGLPPPHGTLVQGHCHRGEVLVAWTQVLSRCVGHTSTQSSFGSRHAAALAKPSFSLAPWVWPERVFCAAWLTTLLALIDSCHGSIPRSLSLMFCEGCSWGALSNLSPMSGFLLAEDGTWETRWQVAAFTWSLGLTAAAGVPPRLCPATAPCFRNRHACKGRASAALEPVVVTETLVVKESCHRTSP